MGFFPLPRVGLVGHRRRDGQRQVGRATVARVSRS